MSSCRATLWITGISLLFASAGASAQTQAAAPKTSRTAPATKAAAQKVPPKRAPVTTPVKEPVVGPPAEETTTLNTDNAAASNAKAASSSEAKPLLSKRVEGHSFVKVYPSASSSPFIGIGPEAVDLERFDGETSFVPAMSYETYSQTLNAPANTDVKVDAEIQRYQGMVRSHLNEKFSIGAQLTSREGSAKAKLSQGARSISAKGKLKDQSASVSGSYQFRPDIILGVALTHLEATRSSETVNGAKSDGKEEHNYVVPSLMHLTAKTETVLAWKAPFVISTDGGSISDEGYFSVRHHYQLSPGLSLEGQVARIFWSAVDENNIDQFYVNVGAKMHSPGYIVGFNLGWIIQHNDGGDNLSADNDDLYTANLLYQLPLDNHSFFNASVNYIYGKGSANDVTYKQHGLAVDLGFSYVL